MRRLSGLWLAIISLLIGMPLALAENPPGTAKRAELRSITVADSPVGKDILVRIDGEYSFQTVRTNEAAIYVDLHGPRIGDNSPSANWASGLLAGYELIEYTDANGQPVVRLEIATRSSKPPIAERESSGLRIHLVGNAVASGSPVLSAKEPEASPSQKNEDPTLVSDILVRNGSSGEVTIDVAMSKSATFHVSELDHPNRLVVDMKGARNRVRLKLIPVSSPMVKDVRVAQFRDEDPGVVRVVADLSGNPVFDAHAYEGGVRIEVKPRRMPAAPPVVSAATKPENAARGDESKPVQQAVLVPASQLSSSPIHPAASAPPEPESEVAGRRPTVVPATTKSAAFHVVKFDHPNSRVVDLGKARNQVHLNSTPVSSPAAKASKSDFSGALPSTQGSREVAAAPQPSPHSATPEVFRAVKSAQVLKSGPASNLFVAQDSQSSGSASSSGQKPAFSGEPISLNLKDVDLKDFFRLVHEISGLNILVDPNVTGSVTTVLDNVPWDQALDVVLRDNGLGDVLEGNLLRIARLDTLMAEQETANKMAAARLAMAPLTTIFRPMNYAVANDVAILLRAWSEGALSKRGSVQVDKRTNTLIISDIASQIPIIQGDLDKLDTKTKQVAIEARIVLANSGFQRTLASALVATIANTSGSTIGATQTGTQAGITPTTTSSKPGFTIPTNPATGFGAIAITNFSQRYLIDAAISAAEIRSQAKTISRPSIITQDNVEGMVQQGTQIPVQTSINNTISVQYVNATLQLTVTPQVTADGHIFLRIMVQNATPGTIITNAAVSINLQQATTHVLVPNGGTVVFGGVTVTQRTNSSTAVPLLGNIPILGNLFKTSNVQDNDQELLFFVSPRLLTS